MRDDLIPAFKKPLYSAGIGILLVLLCAIFPAKSFPSILLAGTGFLVFGASFLWKIGLSGIKMTTYRLPWAFTDLHSNPVSYFVTILIDFVLSAFGLFVGGVLLLSLTT